MPCHNCFHASYICRNAFIKSVKNNKKVRTTFINTAPSKSTFDIPPHLLTPSIGDVCSIISFQLWNAVTFILAEIFDTFSSFCRSEMSQFFYTLDIFHNLGFHVVG